MPILRGPATHRKRRCPSCWHDFYVRVAQSGVVLCPQCRRKNHLGRENTP